MNKPAPSNADIAALIDKGSQTGHALAMAAKLDHTLYQLFFIAFPQHIRSSKTKLDELFDVEGPLGSLSAKIKIAQAFGLIEAHTAAELHKIRKIRNDFAHARDLPTFQHERIKTLVLKLNNADKSKNPMIVYAEAVVILSEKLLKDAQRMASVRRFTDVELPKIVKAGAATASKGGA